MVGKSNLVCNLCWWDLHPISLSVFWIFVKHSDQTKSAYKMMVSVSHSLTHKLYSIFYQQLLLRRRRRRWKWSSNRRRRRSCRRESLSSTTSPLPYGRTFGATTCTTASTTRIPPFRFRITELLRSEWSKNRFVLPSFLVFFVFHNTFSLFRVFSHCSRFQNAQQSFI